MVFRSNSEVALHLYLNPDRLHVSTAACLVPAAFCVLCFSQEISSFTADGCLSKRRILLFHIPKNIIFVPKLHHDQCHRITNLHLTLRRFLSDLCLSGESLLDITIPESSQSSPLWKSLLHSLDNPHQSFTTAKSCQASEQKPSSCNKTAIFSVTLSMDSEIQIVSFSLKVHFMFLKPIVLLLPLVLSLQLKKPSFFSFSLQAVLYGLQPFSVILWLHPGGLSLTYLWFVNMLSTISRTI